MFLRVLFILLIVLCYLNHFCSENIHFFILGFRFYYVIFVFLPCVLGYCFQDLRYSPFKIINSGCVYKTAEPAVFHATTILAPASIKYVAVLGFEQVPDIWCCPISGSGNP